MGTIATHGDRWPIRDGSRICNGFRPTYRYYR
jgi:hypothetical protein